MKAYLSISWKDFRHNKNRQRAPGPVPGASRRTVFVTSRAHRRI